nr:RNA-directed DNA polymerase, eukaryota [Tanacetum cinerariifolium]
FSIREIKISWRSLGSYRIGFLGFSLSINSWTQNTFLKIASKWGDLVVWDESDVPKFLFEEECDSSEDGESDDFRKGRNFGDMEFDNAKSNAESDVEKVSESSCIRETNSTQVKIPITSREDTPQSTDPFNIYDLLQKKKVVTPQPNESDPTYPPGFTPKENHNDGENTVSPKDQVNSTPSTNLHSCHNIALSSQRNFSTPISGGSILHVMDDLIKALWGNLTFDHVVSSAIGNSGGILCVWDPNMFIREHVSSSNYFLVVMGTWSSTSIKLLVISMYAPQELTEKRDLWDYLCMMIDRWEGETVILGDFNEVRTEQERFGSIFNTQGANAFNNFISKSDLFDLPMGADMSSASSAVTYTSVYTDSEPGRVFWGADEELLDGGSPRVIVYGYDGLPMLPVAPPSPYYIPGPEEPQTPPAPQDEDEYEPMFIQPRDPDFMPKPIYPEYIPLKDEHILLAEEQPLPPVVSHTVESPGYVAESDPEEDLEEYEDDKIEDGPVDYLMDRGDDGDDNDGDSFGDDTDDKDEEDEEEEEHLALADSAVVIPTDELVAPPEGTEPVERILVMPTPSPSPLTSLSPPSVGERLARCMAPAALSSPPLPSPLHMPPPVDRRDDIPKIEMPLARGTGEVGYGIRDTWVDPAETVPEIAPMTVRDVNTRVTELAELHEHDTHDLYALLEDVQDSRTRISQPVVVESQWVDLLMEDKITHQETIQIVEDEAYATREAWALLIGLSQAVHFKLQTHQEQAELLALREQPRRARQPGRDARVPNHHDAPRDADSHI